jgi:bifunctional pyridoxal-dependent enzyme with beta-cystathionase and maltose regulon repressor activities
MNATPRSQVPPFPAEDTRLMFDFDRVIERRGTHAWKWHTPTITAVPDVADRLITCVAATKTFNKD